MSKELNAPMRDKYWKEITADEKCDRMRMIVKNLQNALSHAQQTIEQLNRHVHSANEIYFRESRKVGQVEAIRLRGKAGDDEVYF